MAKFAKIIELDEFLTSKNLRVQEPTVQLLDLHRPHLSLVKQASEASDWARSVKPAPGKTYILVLALGASEYYGPNRNGDGFREEELIKSYKTFETNAKVFKSHVNKKDSPSYGRVVKSFYNHDMHRVELVLELDNASCPDIINKIHNKENVAVSMGCRIAFDVCTICGNKAPTRKEYCDHLKFDLGNILPDGRVVAADNPDPNFFDISVVWRPADRTGYMLKKVAFLAPSLPNGIVGSALRAEKVAALTLIAEELSKAADIVKEVTGVGFGIESGDADPKSKWVRDLLPRLAASHKQISDDDLGSLSKLELPRVLKALSSKGIILTTPEFLDLTYRKSTGSPAPEGLAEKLIGLQQDIFELMAKQPSLVGEILGSGAIPPPSAEEEDPELDEKLAKYVDSRSLLPQNLLKKQASQFPITYTDPMTGRQLGTSQHEIMRAQGAVETADTARLAGATAGGLGTYLLMSHLLKKVGPAGKLMSLVPSAAVAAGIHGKLRPNAPTFSDQGVPIPSPTLMEERYASIRDMPWVYPAQRYADITWMVNKHGSEKAASLLRNSGSLAVKAIDADLGLEKVSHFLGRILT
jgi:hypothetical protein